MIDTFKRIFSKLRKNTHTATLTRYYSNQEQGTFGELSIGGEFICFTVEQPWNDNIPYKSCVPTGTYKLIPFNSPAHGFTWQFENPELNVFTQQTRRKSDRFACEFHVANYADNVQGCIGPGMGRATNEGRKMVTNSAKAMAHLRAEFKRRNIEYLHIKNVGD